MITQRNTPATIVKIIIYNFIYIYTHTYKLLFIYANSQTSKNKKVILNKVYAHRAHFPVRIK